MNIAINAFSNCSSMKEMHLEKFEDAFSLNVNIEIPFDCKFIVKDELVEKFKEKSNCQASKDRFMPYSDYLILNSKDYKVILSIIFLRKAVEYANENMKYIISAFASKIMELRNISEDSIKRIEQYFKI